ncbi:MAG: Gfo/Idh/MocA family oxidoreductase [Thermomicrobiales bacterium]|nr:Gfo/Idh/MocA family oxidoreductase [Thermomicrobiales bacterium]MCO5224310.1 Gfo/Idh/MocA family oxidoreductase [Thermomicrobiales bacterium]MCO5229049.1 Gfo/Idh/MocA family oxidoreductase [Thermomicrobiales bacterium]
MSNIVRMGIVGAGTIAQRGIMPHLSQDDMTDKVKLQAVCDPVPGRAAAAAEEYGMAFSSESYEELLEKGDVDAVSICSPIGLHYEQGMMALEAGKHIHFNKTMTTTVAEANELIELAEKKGLKIVASPGEVLRPQVQAVRRAIAEGKIGIPVWAIAGAGFGTYHLDEPERQGKGSVPAIDPSWYFRKPGGGPMYDMSVYAFHGMTTVLGPVKRVSAVSGIVVPERSFGDKTVKTEADDNTGILMDFGNGLFAVGFGSAAGSTNWWFTGTYFGTDGKIEGFNLNGEELEYPERAISDANGGGVAGAQATLPHVVGSHVGMEEAHVFEDVAQLIDWVRDDIASPVTAQHARHVIDIIESSYRAAETGVAQDLTTSFERN